MAAITDPIADLLTRIRNANLAGHAKVSVPASKIKQQIIQILHHEGFIEDFAHCEGEQQGQLEISLKYLRHGGSAIQGLKRISRPGRRVYKNVRDLPRIRNGLGIIILSTSQGVMSDKTARERCVGGEVLCYVW